MGNLAARKLKIIQNIINLDDAQILSEMEKLISDFLAQEGASSITEPPSVYHTKLKFTEYQKKMLKEAEDGIEKGNFYTDEEVRKMTEEWLK